VINDTFQALVEQLFAGDVICKITSEEQYEYLGDQYNREDVDAYLRRLGRALRKTQDGEGYFAAYVDIEDGGVKKHIRTRFSEAINDLEPLICWLRLAAFSTRTDRPLQAGDVLHGSDLLAAIEDAPALVEELDRLSRTRLFSNQSAGAKKQLDSILRRLCEHGYLVARGASGSKYVATGKWSRLYEELQYIAHHEQLDADEDIPEQGEMAG
jgi:hypothetical protein